MGFLPEIGTHSPMDTAVPWGWMANILKIPVFRLALGDDLISRIFIAVYNFFSRAFSANYRSFRSFDPTIAQRSVDRFESLGAKIDFVTPRDGRGKIQMMSFRAEDLEKKIQAFGGSWVRMDIQGNEVFAIVPPKDARVDWLVFKEQLVHFRWEEKEGVLITCDCVDQIPLKASTKCVLHAHSTSISFASDWRRAGFYLGARMDFVFFDPGNTWKNSGRPPSEESFYLEIEAVYEAIKSRYPAQDMWVGGNCGGAPVAAYLKRLPHAAGINFIAEQSFSDLNDFTCPISPFFAPLVKGSLNDDSLQKTVANCPPACQFGVVQLWQDLPRHLEDDGNGRCILVQVREDEYISVEAYERYFRLAKKVSPQVTRIVYDSSARSHHADDFFRYPAPRRQFVEAVYTETT